MGGGRRLWTGALFASLACFGFDRLIVQTVLADEDLPAFFPYVQYPSGGPKPYGIAAGDFTGVTPGSPPDGFPELVIANSGTDLEDILVPALFTAPGNIVILRNLGVAGKQWLGFDTTPVATIDLCPNCVFPFVPHPAEIAVADLDGDGDDDIAVSSGLGIYLDTELGYRPRGMDGVFTLKSNADGTFSSPFGYGMTTRPVRGLAVADLGSSSLLPDFLLGADGYWWKWYESLYFYPGDEQRYDMAFVSYNLGNAVPGMGQVIDLLRSIYDTDPPEPPNDVVIGQFHRPPGSSGPLLDFTAPNPWKALADPGTWDFSLGTNYNPPQPDFVVSTKSEPYPCTGGHWEFFDMVSGRFRMGSVMDDVAGRIGCWIEVFHYTPAGYPTHDCANGTDSYMLRGCGMRVAGIETIGVGHLNGGVKPDLIAETTDTEVAFLLGKGDGTFQYDNTQNAYHVTIGEPGSGLVPIQLLVMDVNQDGNGDIVTSNHGHNSVSVVVSTGLYTAPPP